jgi:hypothetical protein
VWRSGQVRLRLAPGGRSALHSASLTRDLAADAPAVRAGAEADYTTPAAGTVPVPDFIGAWRGVVEVHRVTAPAASCGHGSQDTTSGAILGSHLPGTSRHSKAHGGLNKQLDSILVQ